MFNIRLMASTAILFFAFVTYANAIPVQMHDKTIDFSGLYKQPELAEAFARSYAALESGDNTYANHFPRSSRHGLDSLSGATFGENKRFILPSNQEWSNDLSEFEFYNGLAKRNNNGINRNHFGRLVKRNFDEIDRAGWDSLE